MFFSGTITPLQATPTPAIGGNGMKKLTDDHVALMTATSNTIAKLRLESNVESGAI